MKFEELRYERLDEAAFRQEMEAVVQSIAAAEDVPALEAAVLRLDQANRKLDYGVQLAMIHHSLDTEDAFWKQENDWYDEQVPRLQGLFVQAWQEIKKKPFCRQMQVPEIWFQIKELEDRAYSPAVVALLQEENRLASRYQELVAAGTVWLDGKAYALTQLEPFMAAQDRELRRRASEAYWGWFADHETELADLYGQLVKVRHEMAAKLGFASYVDLAYVRMGRIGYGPQEVAAFRKQILADVVPLVSELYSEKAQELGLEALAYYDEKQGAPRPVIGTQEMTETARGMYAELDEDCGAFFAEMADGHLMDLEARPGKAAGGYCTFIPQAGVPFIFANGNGSSEDVETLTHEAGHAFQAWCARDVFPLECMWPGMESCEIHSMSMEFFTWPWMERFFGEQAHAFRKHHIEGAFRFLPYGALVDQFQEVVYQHPEWSHDQRMKAWRELEKAYLPRRRYEGMDLLERGGWWLRQPHIFMDPFYYIDYCLAQHAALQMWVRMQHKDESAFADYKKICRIGGTQPFLEILQAAHLDNPFLSGSFQPLVKEFLHDRASFV